MTEPHSLDAATETDDDTEVEDLTVGGTWLLDLASAVDFLRRGDRHGLTVWDALEEAVRWWVAERVSLIDGIPDPDIAELAWGDPDPLRSALRRLLAASAIDDSLPIDVTLQQAVRRWVMTMADRYNDDQPWPHPVERRSFPPPNLPTSGRGRR
jgi:hypothetical protein